MTFEQNTEPGRKVARDFLLPAPSKGLTTSTPLMSMRPDQAVLLENFYPFPDRLETREGYVEHVTGFSDVPLRLWVYAKGSGAEELFATTDTGIFDVTSAGALGSAKSALTEGETSAAVISTGASHYFMMVNGTDDLVKYDGTTWSTVAAFGSVNTDTLSTVEVYRQRLFFSVKNTLTLAFLPVNSISGSAVTYDLGAILRRGGYIVSIATWTLDSGYGPEDQLAVATSKGEIGVFAGADPSSAASWSLRGVYYIGEPLGKQPFFKHGGDLLYLSENGLYPLSQAVQSAAIERTRSVTDTIRQFFNDSARQFRNETGWQVVSQPDIPILVVNIPATPVRKQVIMHAQTGAWATFTGWNAYNFARVGSTLYFSTEDTVNRVTGVSDAGAAITATAVYAYNRLSHSLTKQITLLKPFFIAQGNFQYSLSVKNDFKEAGELTAINLSSFGASSLWGTGVWGTAVWGGTDFSVQNWETVPDDWGTFKAIALQVQTLIANVQFLGLAGEYLPGEVF